MTRPRIRNLLLPGAIILSLALSLPAQQEKGKKTPPEKQEKIIEEILVIGKAPKEMPVSTVSRVEFETIVDQRPLDLSQVLKYVPSAYVTSGEKDEFTLKLRGLDSRRIALFIDGVPSYEPYFSNFDLKTVEVESAGSIQVTRGPSSVLYGPNTLGGIVNVITRRPTPEPALNLEASYGENETRSLGLHSSAGWKQLGFIGHLLYQDSAGYSYSQGDTQEPRTNSDYERLSLNAKLFYAPSDRTELLVNGNFYHSAFGIPSSLTSPRPRYWRFKDWDRASLNAGGFAAVGQKSSVRFRAYWVRYSNTLDAYTAPDMAQRQFESTYHNLVSGAFILGDLPTSSRNTLKLSLTLQREMARLQDDIGLPFQDYRQGVYSAAAEDHFVLAPAWTVITGLSLDHLEKFEGGSSRRVNPLAGLRFAPRDNLEIHLSFSRKSRFPSMRSLYSPDSGNPDLRSETGNFWELGTSWEGPFFFSGAIFLSEFSELIEGIRLPDGLRRFYNIGRAHINGLEFQVQRSAGSLTATLNYTYLDHKNQTEDRPLDALPDHVLSFDLGLGLLHRLRCELFGLYASTSSWYDTTTASTFRIPGYFLLNSVLSLSLGRAQVFFKLSNVFNAAYFTEPGFPRPGRTLEAGFSADLFGKY